MPRSCSQPASQPATSIGYLAKHNTFACSHVLCLVKALSLRHCAHAAPCCAHLMHVTMSIVALHLTSNLCAVSKLCTPGRPNLSNTSSRCSANQPTSHHTNSTQSVCLVDCLALPSTVSHQPPCPPALFDNKQILPNHWDTHPATILTPNRSCGFE
jgi:hypothetical protein